MAAALCAAGLIGCGGRVDAPARTRSIEARLSGASASAWRPYVRGVERLSLEAQAALEHDPAALAEAQLEARDLPAAEAALARAPSSPGVESDRAALELLRGQADAAIERLEPLQAARLQPARWNRALALQALGLDLDAAQAFGEVAAAGEPGWSVEAAFRAEQLRKGVALQKSAQRAMQLAGRALLESGTLPPDELVHRFPSAVRYYFNHAVRGAESPGQVKALEPLARALDAASGGSVLERALRSAAARDFAVRAPLTREYRRLIGGAGSAKDRDAQLDALRRAGQDDILLLSLVAFDRVAANLEEVDRLAHASGDPWFRVVVDGKRAEALRDPDAAALLHQTLDRCHGAKLAYRCVPIASQLVGVLLRLHQTAEADRVGRGALAEARAGLPWPSVELLFRLADVARFRLDIPLMRAFLDEGALRSPGDCRVQRASHEMLAHARMLAFDAPGAAAELAHAPRCEEPVTLLRADLLAYLARSGVTVDEQARLAADLDAARAELSAGERAQADAILGRLTVTRDPAAGRALLERAVQSAAALSTDDVDAHKAATYARLSLAVEALERHAPDDALAELALVAGGRSLPCALGLAVDDGQLLRVARGPSGGAQGWLTRLPSPELHPAGWFDDAVRARLDGCAEIAVFAAAPVHGLPRILPPAIAWSYRGPARPPAPPAREQHRLVVADVAPAAELGLPRLAPYVARDIDRDALVLRGPDANPTRVLDALGRATEVELHTHGLVDLERSDASMLVLSRAPDGRTALTAAEIKAHPLTGRPVVALGACRAARVASWLHDPWSLPEAFLVAGARAVFGSPEPIPDAAATGFFAGVTARIRGGASPARALRDERLAWRARPGNDWVDDVLAFQ